MVAGDDSWHLRPTGTPFSIGRSNCYTAIIEKQKKKIPLSITFAPAPGLLKSPDSQVWKSLTKELGRLSQKDCHEFKISLYKRGEFEASLDYLEKFSKTNKKARHGGTSV